MAARARLRVTQEVKQAITEDRTSDVARYLVVKIKDEKLVLANRGSAQSDAAADFNALAKSVGEKEACFIFLKLDKKSEDNYNFLFVAYVPDNAPVRDKMLYASSIDDLTHQIGADCINGTYKCCDKSDLNFEAWIASTKERRGSDTTILTDKEKLLKEERAIDRSTVSAGMKSVQFNVADEVNEAIGQVVKGERSVVAIRVAKSKGREKCVLDKDVPSDASVDDISFPKEPRFCVTSGKSLSSSGSGFVFVFLCPEDAKAMHKMMYATAKSAVMEHCRNIVGSDFSIRVEACDFSSAKSQLLAAKKAEASTSTTNSHEMSFAKPSASAGRRRRGGRRRIRAFGKN